MERWIISSWFCSINSIIFFSESLSLDMAAFILVKKPGFVFMFNSFIDCPLLSLASLSIFLFYNNYLIIFYLIFIKKRKEVFIGYFLILKKYPPPILRFYYLNIRLINYFSIR